MCQRVAEEMVQKVKVTVKPSCLKKMAKRKMSRWIVAGERKLVAKRRRQRMRKRLKAKAAKVRLKVKVAVNA